MRYMPVKPHAPSSSSGRGSASDGGSGGLPPVTSFRASGDGFPKKSSETRGSSLRVGKVITDARALVTPGTPVISNCNSSSARPTPLSALTNRFIDEGEQRVQEEMIDMLTTKLAKKEKECELFRRQHSGIEEMRHQFEVQVADLDSELQRTRVEMTSKVEQLQRDAQHAQLQASRFREEAEAQRVVLQETRRQRERDAEMARGKEQQTQRQMDELRRELSMTRAERSSLESKVISLQDQLSATASSVSEESRRCAALELAVSRSHELIQELTQQLDVSHSRAIESEGMCAQLASEKQSLEDKLQQLSRSLKDVHSRASDAERRKSDLTQAETQLSKQLTHLHRENEELKARNGQLVAQNKQQQMRVAALEGGKSTLEAKQKEACEEVEQARKRCREYQFRIKQLQEEVTFLTKKKQANPSATPQPTAASAPSTTSAIPKRVATPEKDDGVPSWMRD